MLCDYLPWLVPAQPNKQSNILLILLLDQIYKNYAHTCIYLSLIYCFILVYMPHEYLNHVMIICIHKIDNNQRLPNDIIKTEATNDQQKISVNQFMPRTRQTIVSLFRIHYYLGYQLQRLCN